MKFSPRYQQYHVTIIISPYIFEHLVKPCVKVIFIIYESNRSNLYRNKKQCQISLCEQVSRIVACSKCSQFIVQHPQPTHFCKNIISGFIPRTCFTYILSNNEVIAFSPKPNCILVLGISKDSFHDQGYLFQKRRDYFIRNVSTSKHFLHQASPFSFPRRIDEFTY